MKSILKIGGYQFLMNGKINFNALLSTLEKATPVRSYYEAGKYIFRPETEHVAGIEVEFIGDDQFRPAVNGHGRPTVTIEPPTLAIDRRLAPAN